MAQFFTPKRVQEEKYQTLTIDKHDHAGNGLCLSTKPIVVVANALQGESCQVKVSKQSKRVNFAHVVKVLKPSPNRIKPFCQYYDQCGGCSLQHINANNGLALKELALKDFVAKNLNGAAKNIDASMWGAPILSNIGYKTDENSTEYRRRIRLAIDARNKSSIKIGFRAANTQKIIDIQTCPVAVNPINECLPNLRKVLKQLPSISKVGHVVITLGEQELQVAITVTQKLCDKSMLVLQELAQTSNCLVLITGKTIDPTTFPLASGNCDFAGSTSEAVVIEDIPKVKLSIKSTHFLQVNKAVNQQMIANAEQWLSPNANNILYDFFCGSGNFALSLAKKVKAVKGFEGVSEMVEVAKQNAQDIGLKNCDFDNVDLSSKDELKQLSFADQAIVILDPSREGAPQLCEFLATSDVEKIVYVSCNPNSFVRDAAFLLPHYRIDKIKALDMFPFTKHIEMMALFVKH